MKLALASDHAGYKLKEYLIDYLARQGHDVINLGVDTDKVRSDYPDAAKAVGHAVNSGLAERGILICGSGVGASIAANKIKGIYAAICHDTYSAAQGVEHDNMNVLCIGSRVIGEAVAESLADAYISAQFRADVERYTHRFDMVEDMETHFTESES
ncbi:MAG: ribose 5-phosphate isomerase B [Anaerolineae bacterium]|nr:ribose 5-phosphate isomerase B [Anaerolineae bacterium]MCA9887874.1 ribose 5-phosphate isomerase B [Anaerolineae bacterium]MCA9893876.1 ribose 5-phosphate isomerase B [Anaerolineae bacterium]